MGCLRLLKLVVNTTSKRKTTTLSTRWSVTTTSFFVWNWIQNYQESRYRNLVTVTYFTMWRLVPIEYLTIIPRARMGYEAIAHEAEGLMGYWLRGHEGERNNCFSKIQLVGQKNIKTKRLSQVKARLQSSLTAKTLKIWRRFSLLVGYNI